MGINGLKASVGAGVSLLVAGVLALVVLSSIIAFDGLPGIAPSREVAEVRLPDVPPPASELGASSRPSRVRVAAAPRRSERSSRSASVKARSGRQQTGREHVARTRDTGGRTSPEPQRLTPAPQPDPAIEAPVLPLVPAESEPQLVEDVTRQVQEVLDPVTRATQRATGTVGEVADGLLMP